MLYAMTRWDRLDQQESKLRVSDTFHIRNIIRHTGTMPDIADSPTCLPQPNATNGYRIITVSE